MTKSKLQLLAEEAHKHGQPCAYVIDFDCDSAEWALSTSEGNRVENDGDIESIAADETSGTSVFDGNSVSFERHEHGQSLFDGHHRCYARLRANPTKPVLVTVTFNSPPGAQRQRARGRGWNFRSWVQRAGISAAQTPIVSAIHRAISGHVDGRLDDTHILSARAVCADGIDAVTNHARQHERLAIAPVLAGIAMAWKLYPAEAREFLGYYISGGRPLRCPANTLRDQVLKLGKAANQRSDERVKLTWTAITAVSMFHDNGEYSIIRVSAPRVEPVLAAWQSIRGIDARHVDVSKWMRSHQKKSVNQ